MEVGVIALVLAGVGVIYGAVRLGMTLQEQWRGALRFCADSLGLHFEPGSFWKKAFAEGDSGGLPIKLDSYTVSTGKSSSTYTRIVVNAPTSGLALSREGIGSSFLKAFVGEDLQIGVAPFDARVVVRASDEALALAALGDRGRAAALEAIGLHGVTVANDALTFRKSGLLRDGPQLLAIARSMLVLAEELGAVASGGVAARLAEHVAQDPEGSFRRRCLDALLSSRFRRTSAAQGAARAALTDRDAMVQLLAAEVLGPEGVDRLLALAATGSVPAAAAAGAASALGRAGRARADEAARALEAALERRESEVLMAALAGLEQLGRAAPLARLLALVEGADRPHTPAAALALARHASGDVQQTLLALLAEERAGETRRAACDGLAQVGTVEAVEPLLACTKGVFGDRELKAAARGAIERIQARLGDVGAGRLSVLSEGSGGGELSDAESGGQGGLSEA